MGKTDYYQLTAKEAVQRLGVNPELGLPLNEVKSRLAKYGANILHSGKKINPLKLFLSQFNDVLVIILIIAAFISLGLSYVDPTSAASSPGGDSCVSKPVSACEQLISSSASEGVKESLLIFAIVIAIAVVGFMNEYKAEKTVEALRRLVGQKAKVRRGGRVIEIDASRLVPGDIVLIEEGMKVPADMRLLKVNNLTVNEASLTGESVPVSKNALAIDGAAALGDRKNMLFSGTIVAAGVGEGLVVATGQETQIGHIAGMVSEVEEEETPMQKKLDALGRRLGAIILAISILVFVVIFFLDKELINQDLLRRLIFSFTAAVALAVAAIPEGLAFVVRISLALGARRMASKKALVRRLSAVEALGSTDTICTDKTGTLTKGEMTVRKLYIGSFVNVSGSGYETKGEFTAEDKANIEKKRLEPLLRIGLLCNNARVSNGKVLGDPTEGALIISATKAGLDKERVNRLFPRIDEVPFTSERKLMTTIHRTKRGYLVATKGAPDILLDKCDRILLDGKVKKLNKTIRSQVLEANQTMAKDALRVLGFAYKERLKRPNKDGVEEKLIFLGLQGMIDPPRSEVKAVMHRVHAEAGMRVIMITGDYIETAKAIANEIGIDGQAISGVELDSLTQGEFEDKVEEISIYARVNPEHKIRIVKALKKRGHQVAMTGDGVNDAPAIKAADIGIAMGITGTDAAKEASDMILLDDQFLTIIKAIEEGRGIFDNVRKFVNYLLSANIAEVITVLGGVVFYSRLVLSAAQLLFINIVTDGLPAVALGSDPAEKDIMRFKPRRFQEAIINRRVWYEMIIFGLAMSTAVLIHYWWIALRQHEEVRAIAVAFTAMVIYEMVRLVGIRLKYRIRWFANPWLSVAIIASVLLQVAVVYVPSLNRLFEILPIHPIDWLIITLVSLALLVYMRLTDVVLDRIFARPTPISKSAQ